MSDPQTNYVNNDPSQPGEETRDEFVARVAESSPVFLWAPTPRCGITLLQRVITSTRDVLVYGENSYLMQFSPDFLTIVGQEQDLSQDARKALIAGQYNFWSSRAFPNMDRYRRATLTAFFMHLDCYDQSTQADGFPRWGIKTPGANPMVAYRVVRSLLPNSQHVFIYRGLEDVLKSCKARKWISDLNDVAKTTAQWFKNISNMESMKNDSNLLMVQYEELIRSPKTECKVLTSFLGTRDPDLNIFSHKVNTFEGDPSDGFSPNQYIPPEPLTEEERATMNRVASELADQFAMKRDFVPG